MSKQKFYAIKNTNQIVTSWDECKAIVDGLSGAKYKSFKTESEAAAYLLDQLEEQTTEEKAYEIEVVNYVAENKI